MENQCFLQLYLNHSWQDANAGESADWSLLIAGASNPIGDCRIREAHEWLQSRSTSKPQGFTHAGRAIERFGQRCESISNQLGTLTHG